MGIKYLNQIIKKYCVEAVETIYLNELFNKTISIDTSIFLYKYQYNKTYYLISFLKQIIKLLKNGITPYYVFDGKPPDEKKELLMERRKKKEYLYAKIELLNLIKSNNDKIKNNEKLDETFDTIKYKMLTHTEVLNIYNKLLDSDINNLTNNDIDIEIKKQQKKIITVKRIHVTDLILLLDCLGIPYLKTNYEAEVVCAQLNKKNIVNGCITEDSDYLTNAGNYLLRNFNTNSNQITLYKYHILLKELKLNNNQFIDFCILCGCDYTSKITGIGPIKALQLIKKYNTIENIIEYINTGKTKYKVQDNFNYIRARELFTKEIYNEEEYEEIKKNIVLNKPNIDKCIELFKEKSIILSSKILKELNNINKYTNKIIKYKNKKKQQKLTNYFGKSNVIIQEI